MAKKSFTKEEKLMILSFYQEGGYSFQRVAQILHQATRPSIGAKKEPVAHSSAVGKLSKMLSWPFTKR